MKKITLIVLVIVAVISCKKDPQPTVTNPTTTASISGRVQKGPYKNGSALVIYELNSSLGQTGKSFSSIISDDAGNFSLNNISLSSNYVLITANGYYFQEHFNQVSANQLYLEAIADASNNSAINVNLLTHIIKPRIEDLVSKGSSFAAAQTQAQSELKNIMGVTIGNTANFETIDISNDGFLFAMSLLFQRRTAGYSMSYNYTAELGSLLSNFRNDFKNNGLIDNSAIIDTLVFNANRIQLIDAKENLQNYYTGLGINITPPNFEQYIYLFQKKHAAPLYSYISFPDSVFYMIDQGPGSKVKNILDKTALNFTKTAAYLVSAIVPCDSSFTMQFTKYSGTFSIGMPHYGWKMSNSASGFTLTCQRKNFENGLMVYLGGVGPLDSARVDYFQNNSSTPYLSKTIYWQ
ncbi:MAG: hypothetical protein IPJ32_04035 [Sphingobacteriaceae bacterium]|nr:hypothetical protein [Sphingobacteriaceae bacterium]